MDMTGGIIDRFRTMAIARAAVLTARDRSLIQTLLGLAHLLGVASRRRIPAQRRPSCLAGGHRCPRAVAFALIWLATALAWPAKSVETPAHPHS